MRAEQRGGKVDLRAILIFPHGYTTAKGPRDNTHSPFLLPTLREMHPCSHSQLMGERSWETHVSAFCLARTSHPSLRHCHQDTPLYPHGGGGKREGRRKEGWMEGREGERKKWGEKGEREERRQEGVGEKQGEEAQGLSLPSPQGYLLCNWPPQAQASETFGGLGFCFRASRLDPPIRPAAIPSAVKQKERKPIRSSRWQRERRGGMGSGAGWGWGLKEQNTMAKAMGRTARKVSASRSPSSSLALAWQGSRQLPEATGPLSSAWWVSKATRYVGSGLSQREATSPTHAPKPLSLPQQKEELANSLLL